MADIRLPRTATERRIGDLLDDTPGLHLCDLAPLTTLLVWTRNALRRAVVTEWPEVCVYDASIEGSCPRVGWISAGLLVEVRPGGRHIITSTVLAITIERASSVVMH